MPVYFFLSADLRHLNNNIIYNNNKNREKEPTNENNLNCTQTNKHRKMKRVGEKKGRLHGTHQGYMLQCLYCNFRYDSYNCVIRWCMYGLHAVYKCAVY